ncbi:M16 family metallopeptidase [Nonlabens antarcticus]|uniref:M16 family metallopeptidase n=1 Tax=Nonlabens antarcticus TaxID=392714 RepID=UPI001E3B3708|nr:pitrilysin family protein [Nonlabens antarcticus]
MKNLSCTTVCMYLVCLLMVSAFAKAQSPSTLFTKTRALEGVEEYLYTPNGLKILLVQDKAAPVVNVQMVYMVGSKHEVTGNTGSTHLLEHLMFKGTDKFNRENGNSIDTELTRIGAQMNATTWNDRTNYYETIPSDKVELALEIEADRMRNLLLLQEDKDAEMTVVRNEFERGENNPNSVLGKEIWATAYMAHPYHHATIGWRSDIENMPMEDLRDFYDTYYWPNNAYLTVVGDFDKKELFEMIDTHFGKINRSTHEIPSPNTEEPTQYGPRRVTIKKAGESKVVLQGFKIPGVSHEDYPAITVLAELLGGGPLSSLHRELVDGGEAFYAYASASEFQEVGLLTVGTGFDVSKENEDLDKRLIDVIEEFKKNGAQQKNVDRIVANNNAQAILNRDGAGSIAADLAEYIAGGDWTDYINGSKKLQKVTAADVDRVAVKYLVEDQSTTGYFIPKSSGSNPETTAKATRFTTTSSPNFYRDPALFNNFDNPSIQTDEVTITKILKDDSGFNRKTIAGIDVITKKTGAKGFLTVAASFPIDAYFGKAKNEMIPSLTAAMLSKGTTKNDKSTLSRKLEQLGVYIYIGADDDKVSMSFKCLSDDVDTVVQILAEELRSPLFDENEFELLKQQYVGQLQQGLSDPGTQGRIMLAQTIYKEGHPNYSYSIQDRIDNTQNATIADVKTFHQTYFGPKDMHLVAVGDVNNNVIYKTLNSHFKNWKGGTARDVKKKSMTKVEGKTTVISIPEKPSAEFFIAQYTGLDRLNPDYLPFYLGNFILGGDFSGRLMLNVRDKEGLTYGIYSAHSGHQFTGGHWMINASFNPELLQKGEDATMKQLKKWVADGVTSTELQNAKSNLNGSFKIGLATTTGMAANILSVVERGEDPSYVYQYSKDLNAVSVEQVNDAIKKYIDLNKLVIIKAGSLDQNGEPLKK